MRERRLYTLSGLAIAGFMLLLAYAFLQLIQIQRSLDADVGENMLWAISQAEREARRLDEAVLGMALGVVDREEMLLRLDILHSRFALLQDRPQADYFQRIGVAGNIARNADRLAGLSPRLESATGPESLDLLALRAILTALMTDLGRLANHTMVTDRNEKGARRDRQGQTMYLIIGAFAGLMLAGTFLSWQLVVSTRAAYRSEAELRRHKAELEQTVAERTADLHAALAVERRAKDVYRSFITTVSHQFRTPLSIIDMIAQRLVKRPDEFPPDTLAEKAWRIRHATRRLTLLVASVTTAARMDESDVAVSRSVHDLSAIVRDAVTYHKELVPEREVRLDLSRVPLACTCDASLIEQVALNLLSNASKYSPPASMIEVRTWRNEGYVCCSVRDEGLGVPEAEQHQLFTRFFRGSNVASIDGSGLGLNLSRTMVELHEGELTFTSHEGKGSIFIFALPAAAEGSVR